MKKIASGTCSCCGKPLSDPLSVELGIGPVCRINRRIKEHQKRDSNMFGNRANYTWGTDGEILWLKDQGTDCRSLTNDIENCLVEISGELSPTKEITDYRIIYRDSDGEWDGIVIQSLGNLEVERDWVEHSKEQNKPYWAKIEIDFFAIQQRSYEDAKRVVLESEKYFHPAKLNQ